MNRVGVTCKKICFLMLCLLLLASCSVQAVVPFSDKVVISLETGGCFGPCPSYRLTIYGSGLVIYEGLNDLVEEKGRHTTRVDPEVVAELIYEFGKINFFSLEDRYTMAVTDLQTVTLSLTLNDRSKTVVRYGYDAPFELVELEYKIDEAVDVSRWVGDLWKPDLSSVRSFMSPIATPLP